MYFYLGVSLNYKEWIEKNWNIKKDNQYFLSIDVYHQGNPRNINLVTYSLLIGWFVYGG